MDLATVDELLTTTRSVRKRLDFTRDVQRSVILECLQLALQAPTGGNGQGWRWVIVSDPDRRKAVAEIYRGVAEPIFQSMIERGADSSVYDGALYLARNLHEVPVLVIPCIRGRVGGERSINPAPLYGSILPAVWSFMLALRSRGLGSTLTTAHVVREKDMGELLGIPEDYTQVALLPVAYTIGTSFRLGRRKSVEEVVSFDGWDVSASW